MPDSPATLTVDADVFRGFEPTGVAYPESRLLAQIVICGTPMHLEAWEIAVDDETGIKRAVDPAFRDDLEALENMQDCSFQTTQIAGRTYVLVATPHGD